MSKKDIIFLTTGVVMIYLLWKRQRKQNTRKYSAKIPIHFETSWQKSAKTKDSNLIKVYQLIRIR